VAWDECNEYLSEKEVKDIMGDAFDQSKFDENKDKETNLLSRAVLKEIISSHTEQETSTTATTCTSTSTDTSPTKTSKSPQKLGIQIPADVKRNARGRHRSFENGDTKKGKGAGATKRVPRALSMEKPPEDGDQEAPPQGEVDTWESVQAQPSCAVCGMVFTSAGKLDTHIKYSSIHVSNLKKLDDKEKGIQQAEGNGISDKQELESDRCRVLYTGNKHFWRTQDNLDITIYLHMAAKCIEVIAFEGKANFEFPRVYLNETKLVSMITEESIWEKVNKKEEEANKKKFKKDLPSREVLFVEEKRLSIATFILQRLKLTVSGVAPPASRGLNDGELLGATKELLASQSAQMLSLGVSSPKPAGAKKVFYVPEANDKESNVEFDITKGAVTPVLINRRRHSTDQEIKDTLHSVEEMQNDIRNMTKKAEGIANTIHRGVETFNAKARGRNKGVKTYSKARRRWVFAIKRVLRQAQVREVTALLLTYGDKYYVVPKPE